MTGAVASLADKISDLRRELQAAEDLANAARQDAAAAELKLFQVLQEDYIARTGLRPADKVVIRSVGRGLKRPWQEKAVLVHFKWLSRGESIEPVYHRMKNNGEAHIRHRIWTIGTVEVTKTNGATEA